MSNLEIVKNYYKVTLESNDLLSLPKKREYIHSLYGERPDYNSNKKRNIGFVSKFNNAIGFRPVAFEYDNLSIVTKNNIINQKGYKTPADLIFLSLRTPVVSFNIFEFYIPDIIVEHSDDRFSYHTSVIAKKWASFLKKVFPEFTVTISEIKECPKQSLRDFAFEYFYCSLEENVNVNIEFSSKEKLTNEDMDYMIPKLQKLTKDKITIAQYECYSDHEQDKPIHIEIVFLTWYGKNIEQETYEEMGDKIYRLTSTEDVAS